MTQFLAFLYVLALSLLSVYGLLGLFTLVLYQRHRHDTEPCPMVSEAQLPSVTVQLPIYNERFVVERLIDAVVHIDYPHDHDRFQVQLIDDSDDDTPDIVAAVILPYKQDGLNIQHIRRCHRQGYKAGALADALPYATGEFLAIFDADFQPHSDFLQNTMPHFISSPELGMIQTRWGHLNLQDSSLTAAQSIALDKHFVMEQSVRFREGFFPKFNGAAGVWRRSCVNDAGGWQADTVCEDLCLSTRAILKGWHFRYLPQIVAPAELPIGIAAYKSQQARWAKGSIQCLRKYFKPIVKDRKSSLTARLYALLSMSAYFSHILFLFLILLQIPLLVLDVRFSPAMLIFTVLGLGQPILFILAQKEIYSDWARHLIHFPTLLFIAVGTAPSNSLAIFQAFFDKDHPFVRTPKGLSGENGHSYSYKQTSYRFFGEKMLLVELFLFFYAFVGLIMAVILLNPGPIFLLLMSVIGFGYTIILQLRDIVQDSLRIRFNG